MVRRSRRLFQIDESSMIKDCHDMVEVKGRRAAHHYIIQRVVRQHGFVVRIDAEMFRSRGCERNIRIRCSNKAAKVLSFQLNEGIDMMNAESSYPDEASARNGLHEDRTSERSPATRT
ncbi:MAG: hypothetical protein BGO12_22125 [Verrucomicrobia bacterium 61-8]|nr:MAG: hypothetical protein BGO12_22125 [Verrucomicrobia bacterium 61-8]